MTLARFDMRCTLDGKAAVEEHHVINRSQGGGDGPTVYLCPECHSQFTAERWQMWLDDAGLWVADKATGEVLWRRLMGIDGKDAFIALHVARESLEALPGYIPYLDDQQLAALFRELSDVGKRGWSVQCGIVFEALSYRFVHGTKMERAKALASALGVSVPTLYDYAGVWDKFHNRLPELVEAFGGRTSYIVEAARHDDADELVDHALEEFNAGPYPVAQFRAEARGQGYTPKRCPWLSEDGEHCERYPKKEGRQ